MDFIEETTVKKNDHSLWAEKFRPLTMDDYIGNESVKEVFSQMIKKNDIPHILLFGPPGTGKCLDGSELIDIEMDLSEDEYEILKNYEILE